MTAARLSRLVVAAAVLIAAALAIAAVGTGTPSGAGAPAIELTRATHDLTIYTSRPNRAVVEGADLAPGDIRRGRVNVRVTAPARVSLAADRFGRQPGPNGGQLIKAMRLQIDRISARPGVGGAVYKGPLASFRSRHLGRWRPGRSYRYRVRVRFRSEPAAQDSLQGARTTFRLVWRATAVD